MGVDPGTLIMGFSVIRADGKKIALLEMDVLKLPSKKDNYERLQLIHEKVTELVKKYRQTHTN